MSKNFKLISLGDAKWILGTRVRYEKDSIIIDQEKYINDILEKFKMMDCKSVLTPIVKENSIKNSEQPVDKNLYLSMVGSLIYLAVISRPDIAFAVSQVSQAMANPIQENFIAVKRILRYISGTKNYSITYSKNGNKILHGYSDSDWGGN